MRIKLHWQIIIALGLGVLAGALTEVDSQFLGVGLLTTYKFLGTLFLNALKMIIVPLIVASIVTGIAGLGSDGGLGRLGMKTLGYYAATSVIAILIGLVMVNIFVPGVVDGQPAREIIPVDAAANESVVMKVEGRSASDVVEVFLRMIPTNVVAAAADGQMLGLIFFSLLFGYFMSQLPDSGRGAGQKKTLVEFWQGVFEVMMRITNLVMRFAPVGVFALVAGVVTRTGMAAVEPLAWFVFTVLLALATHMFVAMPLILKLVGKVNPARHYKAMAPAMLTAFSTASSSATLPVTLDCVENKAGVSNRVTSFVLPLGATVNMDGTALYECVAAMFIAQAFGIELGFTEQFIIVLTALLTSIGVAGIPAASLVAISIILAAIGLPAEAIGLILVVDRVLDMCRTSVNVFSDSCGAVVIAKMEGEDGVLVK